MKTYIPREEHQILIAYQVQMLTVLTVVATVIVYLRVVALQAKLATLIGHSTEKT